MKVDLSRLTAQTIDNVLAVVAQAEIKMVGSKIPVVNQELATLQSIGRKIANGELVVVEPVAEDVPRIDNITTFDGNTSIAPERTQTDAEDAEEPSDVDTDGS